VFALLYFPNQMKAAGTAVKCAHMRRQRPGLTGFKGANDMDTDTFVLQKQVAETEDQSICAS